MMKQITRILSITEQTVRQLDWNNNNNSDNSRIDIVFTEGIVVKVIMINIIRISCELRRIGVQLKIGLKQR